MVARQRSSDVISSCMVTSLAFSRTSWVTTFDYVLECNHAGIIQANSLFSEDARAPLPERSHPKIGDRCTDRLGHCRSKFFRFSDVLCSMARSLDYVKNCLVAKLTFAACSHGRACSAEQRRNLGPRNGCAPLCQFRRCHKSSRHQRSISGSNSTGE